MKTEHFPRHKNIQKILQTEILSTFATNGPALDIKMRHFLLF